MTLEPSHRWQAMDDHKVLASTEVPETWNTVHTSGHRNRLNLIKLWLILLSRCCGFNLSFASWVLMSLLQYRYIVTIKLLS